MSWWCRRNTGCSSTHGRLGASVEMIGSVVSPTLLALSVVAEVATLANGVTGNIEFPFNQKNMSWLFLQSSLAVLQLVARNEKVETWV